jgi:hypothetical protein
VTLRFSATVHCPRPSVRSSKLPSSLSIWSSEETCVRQGSSAVVASPVRTLNFVTGSPVSSTALP